MLRPIFRTVTTPSKSADLHKGFLAPVAPLDGLLLLVRGELERSP